MASNTISCSDGTAIKVLLDSVLICVDFFHKMDVIVKILSYWSLMNIFCHTYQFSQCRLNQLNSKMKALMTDINIIFILKMNYRQMQANSFISLIEWKESLLFCNLYEVLWRKKIGWKWIAPFPRFSTTKILTFAIPILCRYNKTEKVEKYQLSRSINNSKIAKLILLSFFYQ